MRKPPDLPGRGSGDAGHTVTTTTPDRFAVYALPGFDRGGPGHGGTSSSTRVPFLGPAGAGDVSAGTTSRRAELAIARDARRTNTPAARSFAALGTSVG
jgi:hypothetical protein